MNLKAMPETRVAKKLIVTVSREPLEFGGWDVPAALISVTQMDDGAVLLSTRWFLLYFCLFFGGKGLQRLQMIVGSHEGMSPAWSGHT